MRPQREVLKHHAEAARFGRKLQKIAAAEHDLAGTRF
jgi:hypothetical protein